MYLEAVELRPVVVADCIDSLVAMAVIVGGWMVITNQLIMGWVEDE
jgi:hypothetical protein